MRPTFHLKRLSLFVSILSHFSFSKPFSSDMSRGFAPLYTVSFISGTPDGFLVSDILSCSIEVVQLDLGCLGDSRIEGRGDNPMKLPREKVIASKVTL